MEDEKVNNSKKITKSLNVEEKSLFTQILQQIEKSIIFQVSKNIKSLG